MRRERLRTRRLRCASGRSGRIREWPKSREPCAGQLLRLLRFEGRPNTEGNSCGTSLANRQNGCVIAATLAVAIYDCRDQRWILVSQPFIFIQRPMAADAIRVYQDDRTGRPVICELANSGHVVADDAWHGDEVLGTSQATYDAQYISNAAEANVAGRGIEPRHGNGGAAGGAQGGVNVGDNFARRSFAGSKKGFNCPGGAIGGSGSVAQTVGKHGEHGSSIRA